MKFPSPAYAKLYQKFLQYPSVSTDTRKIKQNDIFFALSGENFNGNRFAQQALDKGASFVVVDDAKYHQAQNPKFIKVTKALNALQWLAKTYRKTFGIPFIAITGSNGKTTTKELMHSVLSTEKKCWATKGNLNNHIGVPLTLLAMPKDSEIAIIEMGANKHKDIEELVNIALPTHGILTNIGKAHLERFGSIEGVQQTKGELFQFIRQKKGVAFVNATDKRVVEEAQGIEQQIHYGSPQSTASCTITQQSLDSMKLNIQHTEWKTPLPFPSQLSGTYNAINILAAVTIGQFFGISQANLQKGIAQYLPTNNRSQFIQQENRQVWLDAYNANPSSMKASIQNIFHIQQSNTALIIGDMFELGDTAIPEHHALGEFINQFNPQIVIGIGPLMKHTIEPINAPKYWFQNVNSAQDHIKPLLENTKLILMKGSRGIAIERLLPHI